MSKTLKLCLNLNEHSTAFNSIYLKMFLFYQTTICFSLSGLKLWEKS